MTDGESNICLIGLTEGRMKEWEGGDTRKKNISEQMKTFNSNNKNINPN